MNPAIAADTAVYVYCVAPAEPFMTGDWTFSSQAIGGTGAPVRVVPYEDLVAVVSTSPNIRYTLRREYLDAHQRVLAEALSRSDILPVSFGSMARNDRQVQEILLRRQFDELHDLLEYVRDRVELDLRAYWQQEQLFAEIIMENEMIAGLREFVATGNPDATYYERIQLGELTEAAIRDKSEAESARIMEELEPLAVETKLSAPRTDMMLLNAAFLVDKVRQAAFDAQVHRIRDENAGRLVLQYVGPVAPYNFVTLHVSWEG